MQTVIKNNQTRILTGVVVSTKMAKTVVVEVKRFFKHPRYGKFISVSKRYKAHDETGRAKLGEQVKIKPTRPRSRDKFFELI